MRKLNFNTLIISLTLLIFALFIIPSTRARLINNSVTLISGVRNFVYGAPFENASPETLSLLQSQVQMLEQENKRLEAELGFRDLENPQIPVRVLSEHSQIYKTTFVQLAGTPAQVGSFVYARGGVVVGTIAEISNNIGKVDFLGNKDKFIAEVASTGELLELSGSGLGYYTGSIPKSSSVISGSLITLKGYPKSIVGTVSSLEDSGTSLYTVWVRAPLNIAKVDIFYVNSQ
jgi:cell shape-determining protein MreC